MPDWMWNGHGSGTGTQRRGSIRQQSANIRRMIEGTSRDGWSKLLVVMRKIAGVRHRRSASNQKLLDISPAQQGQHSGFREDGTRNGRYLPLDMTDRGHPPHALERIDGKGH